MVRRLVRRELLRQLAHRRPGRPHSGKVRVRRGGSWHTWPLYARVAFRNWNTPETRYVLLGFRLLREQGPKR